MARPAKARSLSEYHDTLGRLLKQLASDDQFSPSDKARLLVITGEALVIVQRAMVEHGQN